MDRQEFCKELVRLREQSHVKKSEMCRNMGLQYVHLRRIERGENSFGINKAIRYLNFLGYNLVAVHNDTSYVINSREKLAAVAAYLRSSRGLTIPETADLVGVSNTMIATLEKTEIEPGIENVLKFFKAFGFEILMF